MTQEALSTPNDNEHWETRCRSIPVKIEDNPALSPHGTSKRFHRRKPMKCFSKGKYHNNKSSRELIVDENNNISETSINTEVIDIEEECVKAKSSIKKERIGFKRKKGSLDQLLSRVVAKKSREDEKFEQQKRQQETIIHSADAINKKERGDMSHHHILPYQTHNETISDRRRIRPTSMRPSQQRQTLLDPTDVEEQPRIIHRPIAVLYEPIEHYSRQIHRSVRPAGQNEKLLNSNKPFSQPETTYYTSSIVRTSSISSSSSSSHGGGGGHEEDEGKIPNSNKPKITTAATTTTDNSRYAKLSNSQLQRRLVANARERSRVHALSNAFNALRSTIPSYSSEQKLSKLTILRVAINYIDALTQLLAPKTPATQRRFEMCVDECTAVLQTEYGRSKTK